MQQKRANLSRRRKAGTRKTHPEYKYTKIKKNLQTVFVKTYNKLFYNLILNLILIYNLILKKKVL